VPYPVKQGPQFREGHVLASLHVAKEGDPGVLSQLGKLIYHLLQEQIKRSATLCSRRGAPGRRGG